MEAAVAAPGAVVGGLVVVEGVGTAVAAARAAVGAGAAGPSMGRRTVLGAAGLLFALAAAGVVLGSLAGLLPGALALPVGGLLAGVGAKRRLRPGSSGWAKRWPQVGQSRWMTRTSIAAHPSSARASRRSS
jgi:hypothetical protein